MFKVFADAEAAQRGLWMGKEPALCSPYTARARQPPHSAVSSVPRSVFSLETAERGLCMGRLLCPAPRRRCHVPAGALNAAP